MKVLAIAMLLLCASCGASQDSAQATATASPEGAKVITQGVMAGLFDLTVGQSRHVLEANTDQGEANGLMLARSAGNRSGIEALSSSDTYKHYGDGGSDGNPPTCTVSDQDPVALDDDTHQPASPVACTLADGSTLYVIRWTR